MPGGYLVGCLLWLVIGAWLPQEGCAAGKTGYYATEIIKVVHTSTRTYVNVICNGEEWWIHSGRNDRLAPGVTIKFPVDVRPLQGFSKDSEANLHFAYNLVYTSIVIVSANTGGNVYRSQDRKGQPVFSDRPL